MTQTTITNAFKTITATITEEQAAPLNVTQQALIYDLCLAVGINPIEILGIENEVDPPKPRRPILPQARTAFIGRTNP